MSGRRSSRIMTSRVPKTLQVCVDARLTPGASGGIEQVVIGLANGFANMLDGRENYHFLTFHVSDSWLRPYIAGPCKILHTRLSFRAKLRSLLNSIPGASALAVRLLKLFGNTINLLPLSDGTIEAAEIDIMHFTFQSAFLTGIPNIYHPWDLQHVHLPSFFAEHERLIREIKFRTYCNQAQMVSVASRWMKKELIKYLGVQQSKVKVVPMAPSVDAYPAPIEEDLSAARQKFRLPDSFLFYPAKTWGHKNHMALLEALSILRAQHGLNPPLICSGGETPFFHEIRDRMMELDLASQVRFIGFVTPLELISLYRLSRCVIFPSKYEGWGLPITEAMRLGVPVGCSALPVLREQAGDAALFFDPGDPHAIAGAIGRLWTEEELHNSLSRKGIARASRYSWDRTARIFRAHYRRLAGRPLTEEDTHFLSEASA
jgi:glycosyltransferase involved in cell wall biosynthesis